MSLSGRNETVYVILPVCGKPYVAKDKIIKQLQDIETEGKEAIKDEDKIFMIRINEQLDDLRNEAVFSNPSTWAHHFKEIVEGGGFINEKEAEYYTDKGIKAIEEGDVDELKRCVRQLSLLLPEEEKKKNPLSGISR